MSYPAAAAAGSLLAVCSCTIVPLFAGIYRKGAGIGPAMTFLFFAPAGNIMALAYTGSILGPEFAVARVVFCLMFGIGIGILMALVFWRDDASHDAQTDTLFAAQASIAPAALGVLLSLVFPISPLNSGSFLGKMFGGAKAAPAHIDHMRRAGEKAHQPLAKETGRDHRDARSRSRWD